jgi:hypothetical protein
MLLCKVQVTTHSFAHSDLPVLALQLAKMVKRPVISIVSQQLFNFENGVNCYVKTFPDLAGTR